MERRWVIGGVAAVLACLPLLLPAGALALQLPAAVLAPLQAEVDRTSSALAKQRTQLVQQVQAQREAAATQELTRQRADLAEGTLGLLPGFASAAEPATAASEDAAREAKDAQAALDRSTATAADLQGASLDAQRRLKALQRAASSDPAEQTGDGVAYRFGSGGPAVSAASLDRYLESKASPMAGSGAAFLKAGLEHRIDPRLVVAIAGAESYFGLQTCAAFNGWGWGCPNSPYAFRSWGEAFDVVAGGLRENYLDDGLTTVGQIHLRYAPPNAANDPTNLNYAWADNVARFLIEQGGDPQNISGVAKPSR